MKLSAKHTVSACFVGAMVQALVINFSPLLFLTFENEFGKYNFIDTAGIRETDNIVEQIGVTKSYNIIDSSFTNNSAYNNGGAIYNRGSMGFIADYDDVLFEISRLSDGGLRDAINMLDQLSSLKNDDFQGLDGSLKTISKQIMLRKC